MFDGCYAVNTVTVVEVDVVHTKTRKRFEAGFADIRGVGADLARAIGFGTVAELGSDEDVVSFAGTLKPFANEVFAILELALRGFCRYTRVGRKRGSLPVHVNICTVPKCYAELVSTVKDFETFFI